MSVDSPIYDKAHFLAKLGAIPDSEWCMGEFEDHYGRHCAGGHCGAAEATAESQALYQLLGFLPKTRGSKTAMAHLPRINDGADPRYQQPTPRARILAALHDLPQ